ncbi:MAG: hypothetical protein RQ760_00855 [Sedimentisphaerales bacterium]|nr:hypothetical protein [Sedimentisphaerales bacterium]
MADYDSNMIKPVIGLQGITGLTPAKRREGKKRRQQLNQENEEKDEQQTDESFEQQDISKTDEELTENPGGLSPDSTGIDFCA